MNRLHVATLLGLVLALGACAASSPSTGSEAADGVASLETAETPAATIDPSRYEAVEGPVIVLTAFEEDWCSTFEGRARGWLVADELSLVYDPTTGDLIDLDEATVDLLDTVTPENPLVELGYPSAIEPFLEYPVPSPVACRLAYEARDE